MYRVAVRCRVWAPDQASVDRAIARVQLAMTPPEQAEVSRWIAALSVATRGAKTPEADAMIAFELYSGALRRYPADVAKAACTALATRPPKGGTNWFPSLGELVAECDRLAGPRQVLLAGLRSWKPATEADRRAAERRDWLLLEAKAREDALNCRRGDPDRHSALVEFADVAKAHAWGLRAGVAP